MVEPTIRGGDVALFIDWENFKISLSAGSRSPNLSSLKEEVSNQGRVVVAKAYADWVTRAPELRGASQFINDPPSLYAAGIEPVFVPTRMPSTQASSANGIRTYRVKNSVDVKMTADCIECAHSYPNIGTFVLVSGDSDFLHVVNALRTMGKRVVVIGVSWSTSRRLADQVDSLLLYDKDVDPVAPQPAVLPQHAARTVTPPSVPGAPSAPSAPAADAPPELPEVIRAIEEIIREDRVADVQPLLTSIKQRLMRRFPSFDEKKLGFSGFKKLMARAAEDGNIKLIHSGLVDWAILADEEVPEGTTEETPSGVAARPGRRRGGRRRHGSQRDSDVSDEAAGDSEGDADAIDEEDGAEDTEVVAAEFEDTLEETAATDFEPLEVEHPAETADGPEDEAVQAPWFDADEEVDAAGVPVAAAPARAAVAAPEAEPDADADQPEDVFGNDEALAAAVREAVDSASLPADPDDGRNPERVSDLVVMADHLEHRQGARHVAFTYLVNEVSDALEQGLEAGNPQIAERWTGVDIKDYVSRALRGLATGGFFKRSIIAWREDGQRKQRRIINLVRSNELVGQMLTARLGPAASMNPPLDPPSGDEPAEAAAQQATTDVAEAQVPVVQESSPSEQPPVEPEAVVSGSDEPEAVVNVGDESEAPVSGSDEPEAPVSGSDEPEAPVSGSDEPEAPVSGSGEPEGEAEEESADEPQPQPADTEDDQDDIFDEPQPRSTRRRRPFTSRLLRS